MNSILALDVGAVRIGVAICEQTGLPAVPLTTIVRINRDKDLDKILELAKERQADTIVVGYPLRLDGTVGPAATQTDSFILALQGRFSGQVVRQDERLTTAAATKKLRQLEVSGSKRRAHVDEAAAVEILNSFLAARSRA